MRVKLESGEDWVTENRESSKGISVGEVRERERGKFVHRNANFATLCVSVIPQIEHKTFSFFLTRPPYVSLHLSQFP